MNAAPNVVSIRPPHDTRVILTLRQSGKTWDTEAKFWSQYGCWMPDGRNFSFAAGSYIPEDWIVGWRPVKKSPIWRGQEPRDGIFLAGFGGDAA